MLCHLIVLGTAPPGDLSARRSRKAGLATCPHTQGGQIDPGDFVHEAANGRFWGQGSPCGDGKGWDIGQDFWVTMTETPSKSLGKEGAYWEEVGGSFQR